MPVQDFVWRVTTTDGSNVTYSERRETLEATSRETPPITVSRFGDVCVDGYARPGVADIFLEEDRLRLVDGRGLTIGSWNVAHSNSWPIQLSR